jgi:hypothetical protein
MPRQTLSSPEAVIAAQRASRKHMSRNSNDSPTTNAPLSSALQHEDITAELHSPRKSICQRAYLAGQIDYQLLQRLIESPNNSMISTSSNIHRTLTTSIPVTSFETQTSCCNGQSFMPSTRSSILCVRDYPTKDVPLPGWQLHLVEDEADTYEPLQDSDRYLYDKTLRGSDKEKVLSWKGIKQVGVTRHSVVFQGPDTML